MYNKLSAIDKFIYDNEIKICDECKSFDTCKQQLTGQRPSLVEDKHYGSVRIAHMLCDKRYGVVYGSYKNSILNVPKFHHTALRDKIVKNLINKCNGFLYGDAGIGKSTIMQLIANHFYKQGFEIMYEAEFNIATDLKDFNNENESILQKMKKYQEIDILFIDDMFRQKMTSYKLMDILNPIIQYRVDNGKPTYINSNYSITELKQKIELIVDAMAGKTICDRLNTLGVYKLEGKNYRIGESK